MFIVRAKTGSKGFETERSSESEEAARNYAHLYMQQHNRPTSGGYVVIDETSLHTSTVSRKRRRVATWRATGQHPYYSWRSE